MMFSPVLISLLVLAINGLPIENNERNLLKGVNPEFLGGGFEGDMLFPPNLGLSRGVAIYGQRRRWPYNIIPYNISAITNAKDRDQILNSMSQLMFDVATPMPGQIGRQVCVYFRPAEPGDSEVLKIQYGNGCSASVGYTEYYQKTVNLQQAGCFYNGIIQHELIHVLGFFHEQSRPDRDSYITVNEENILQDQTHNFQKFTWEVDVESQGSDYDYGSIMHYPVDAFSKNGKHTITSSQNNVVMGQREKLSATDIREIRHYYKC